MATKHTALWAVAALYKKEENMKITHKFQLDFLEKDGVTRLNAMQSDANTRVVEVSSAPH